MALWDFFEYLLMHGSRELREQGFARAGLSILERRERNAAYWDLHLNHNRELLACAAERLEPKRGGTLLILGAGRLLDIPLPVLAPLFERFVLVDADFTCQPRQKRMLAKAGIKNAEFRAEDVTGSVVAEAEAGRAIIKAQPLPSKGALALSAYFKELPAPVPPWSGKYSDLRMVTSSNLLSQLGHYPRLYLRNEFWKRFRVKMHDLPPVLDDVEQYLGRVRAQHIKALAAQKNVLAFLSSDYGIVNYELGGGLRKAPILPEIEVDELGKVKFPYAAEYEESDPLYGQKLSELWPTGTALEGPHRWAWHILPQGCERAYKNYGRVHLVEAWIKYG